MKDYSKKNQASLTVLGELIINEAFAAGRVFSLNNKGDEVAASTNPNYKTRVYLYADAPNSHRDWRDTAEVTDLDFPAYVSDSPSEHRINPALINAVCERIANQ